jgi:chemotaxis signal transduction protein
MIDSNTLAREILVKRARQLARPIVDLSHHSLASDAGNSVIAVRIGDERLGIALDHTTEVYRASELTPIPGARPPVVGVIAWRGRVLTVLDIAHSRRGPVVITDATRIIVIGKRSVSFGIVADDVDDIQDVNTLDLKPVENVSPARLEIIRGMTNDALVVLDVAALIARFAPNQQSTGVSRE